MRNPFTSSKKSESEEETLDANLHQLAREDAAPGETTPDLSLARTLLLSASVTLASLSLGFAYHTVTVTLNLLAEDLKISEGDLQWASNAYLLGLGCISLISGRAADILGVSTFTTFALISSFMKSDVGFFICRAITGMGSAMMNASNAGLIVENIKPGRTRSLLISISSSGVAVGNALGAGIAGPLVEATQWRAAFWLLSGLTLIPLLISAFGVKDRAVALSRADKRFDWLGGFSFTAGFVLLFFAISQARAAKNGWGTDYIIATLVLSLVLVGCAFLWDSYLERKTGYPPILRPSILTRRKGKLTLLCFVIFCCLGAHNGLIYNVTIYYQRVLQLTPSQTALRLLPGPVVGVVLSVVVGWYLDRVPSHWFLAGGACLTGLSNVLYAIRKDGSVFWSYEFTAQLLSYGVFGLSLCTSIIYITREVPPAEVAVGTSCLQIFVLLGGCCGAALSTVIYADVGSLDVKSHRGVLDADSAVDLVKGLRAAHWFWAGLCFFAALLVLLLLRASPADSQPDITAEGSLPRVQSEEQALGSGTIDKGSQHGEGKPDTATANRMSDLKNEKDLPT